MKTKMRYIDCYGRLFRLTEKQYVKLLHTIASGDEADLRLFGHDIAPVKRWSSIVVREEAAEILKEISCTKQDK